MNQRDMTEQAYKNGYEAGCKHGYPQGYREGYEAGVSAGRKAETKMGEVTIKIGCNQKWQKLLLYMQNSPNTLFRIKFDNHDQASDTYNRLHKAMLSRPSWYNLILCERGCDIYVIKPDKARKVVITYG